MTQDSIETRSTLLRGPETLVVSPFRSDWSNNEDQSKATQSQAKVVDPEIAAYTRRISQLEREIIRLNELIAKAEDANTKERQAAVDAARVQAEAQITRDDLARTQLLGRALEESLKAQASFFDRLEGEAVRIAAAALEPVFGDAANPAELVLGMIAHQCRALQERAILEMRYSPADGIDADALSSLLAENAQSVAELIVDPALPAGSVRLSMRLGHVRLDLKNYGHAVLKVLRDLSEPQAETPTTRRVEL